MPTELEKCTKERIRHTFVILGSKKTSFEKLYSRVSVIYQASDMGQADPSSDLSQRQETMGRRFEKNKLHCWQETRKWSLIWLLLSLSFCRHHTSLPRPGPASPGQKNIFPSQTKISSCSEWQWRDTICGKSRNYPVPDKMYLHKNNCREFYSPPLEY